MSTFHFIIFIALSFVILQMLCLFPQKKARLADKWESGQERGQYHYKDHHRKPLQMPLEKQPA